MSPTIFGIITEICALETKKPFSILKGFRQLVGAEGFEPPTLCL